MVNSKTGRAYEALRHDSMCAELVAFDAEWVPDFKGSNHPISATRWKVLPIWAMAAMGGDGDMENDGDMEMGIWGIWDWEAIDIDRYMSFGEDVDISTRFFLKMIYWT